MAVLGTHTPHSLCGDREQLVGDNSLSPPCGSLGLTQYVCHGRQHLDQQSFCWPRECSLLNPGSDVEEKGNSGFGAQDHSGVEQFCPASHIPFALVWSKGPVTLGRLCQE